MAVAGLERKNCVCSFNMEACLLMLILVFIILLPLKGKKIIVGIWPGHATWFSLQLNWTCWNRRTPCKNQIKIRFFTASHVCKIIFTFRLLYYGWCIYIMDRVFLPLYYLPLIFSKRVVSSIFTVLATYATVMHSDFPCEDVFYPWEWT